MTTLSMAEVRRMIRDLRSDVNETLDVIEARLRRRSPTRRAKVSSARMTPALRQKIREMAAQNPDMPMHEIAAALKVNVGRVSEVLADDQPPEPSLQPALPERMP